MECQRLEICENGRRGGCREGNSKVFGVYGEELVGV